MSLIFALVGLALAALVTCGIGWLIVEFDRDDVAGEWLDVAGGQEGRR